MYNYADRSELRPLKGESTVLTVVFYNYRNNFPDGQYIVNYNLFWNAMVPTFYMLLLIQIMAGTIKLHLLPY